MVPSHGKDPLHRVTGQVPPPTPPPAWALDPTCCASSASHLLRLISVQQHPEISAAAGRAQFCLTAYVLMLAWPLPLPLPLPVPLQQAKHSSHHVAIRRVHRRIRWPQCRVEKDPGLRPRGAEAGAKAVAKARAKEVSWDIATATIPILLLLPAATAIHCCCYCPCYCYIHCCCYCPCYCCRQEDKVLATMTVPHQPHLTCSAQNLTCHPHLPPPPDTPTLTPSPDAHTLTPLPTLAPSPDAPI